MVKYHGNFTDFYKLFTSGRGKSEEFLLLMCEHEVLLEQHTVNI